MAGGGVIVPEPLSRWTTEDGRTLTVQQVVRPLLAIHSPWVECWINGEIHKLPLDERWGTGLTPVTEVSDPPLALTRRELADKLGDWMDRTLDCDMPAMSRESFMELAAEAVADISERPA